LIVASRVIHSVIYEGDSALRELVLELKPVKHLELIYGFQLLLFARGQQRRRILGRITNLRRGGSGGDARKYSCEDGGGDRSGCDASNSFAEHLVHSPLLLKLFVSRHLAICFQQFPGLPIQFVQPQVG
jgi:hypothetical protein